MKITGIEVHLIRSLTWLPHREHSLG
jgi:hypothetical protein